VSGGEQLIEVVGPGLVVVHAVSEGDAFSHHRRAEGTIRFLLRHGLASEIPTVGRPGVAAASLDGLRVCHERGDVVRLVGYDHLFALDIGPPEARGGGHSLSRGQSYHDGND